MTFLYRVNRKYLVSIDAETALQAQSKLMAYRGVWEAESVFNSVTISADEFLQLTSTHQTLSMTGLWQLSTQLNEAEEVAAAAKAEYDEASQEFRRLQILYQESMKARDDAKRRLDNAATRKAEAGHACCLAREKIGVKLEKCP